MTSLLHAVVIATLGSTDVAETPTKPLGTSLDVLGLQVCVGAVPEAEPCDLRLLSPPEPEPAAVTEMPSRAEPLELSIFGRTLCLGAHDEARCDLTLGPTPSSTEA